MINRDDDRGRKMRRDEDRERGGRRDDDRVKDFKNFTGGEKIERCHTKWKKLCLNLKKANLNQGEIKQ